MGKSKHHSPKSRFNWAFPGWCCYRKDCVAEDCEVCFIFRGKPSGFKPKRGNKNIIEMLG